MKKIPFYLCLWAALLVPSGAPSALEIAAISPPRVFTPNGDGVNDVITFRLQGPGGVSGAAGKIYDLRGASVGEMRALSADTFVWDGKDSDGRPAPKGIYIYRIAAQGSAKTGTVVVAR